MITTLVGRWLCRRNWHLPMRVEWRRAQALVDAVAPGETSRIRVCRFCLYPRFWCKTYPGLFRIDATARRYTGRLIVPSPEQVREALSPP